MAENDDSAPAPAVSDWTSPASRAVLAHKQRKSRWFYHPPGFICPELTVERIGIVEWMKPGLVDRPRGTHDYLFMFFYEAVYVAAADGLALRPPGTLFLWTPGARHWYGHPDHAWNHSWVHCEGPRIEQELRRQRLPLNVPLVVGDAALIEKYLLDLYRELTAHDSPAPFILGNVYANWFCELARKLSGETSARRPPAWLRRVREHLEANFAAPLKLAELAQLGNVSVPHLAAEFKRHYGAAPIDFALGLRLEQAAYLLRDRNLRVGEVAARVGYEDIYHFSKLFKKRFGVSPRAWRQTQ